MSEDANQGPVTTTPELGNPPEPKAAETPDVGVALDLVDMPDGRGCKFHFHFLPDGVFDPNRASHQCGRAIQIYLNQSESHFREFLRKREADMIQSAVLKVCEPVETIQPPSEATH